MTRWTIALVFAALAGTGAARAEEVPGAADASKWVRPLPDGTAAPVRRQNDRFPLSDQKNTAGWKLYAPLTDEFRGGKLNEKRWSPFNPGWKGRQPAFFWKENVKVSGGMLHLTMRKTEAPEMPKDEGFHDYTSAAVKSLQTVLYGYFEVRARPMRSAGSSSFWFYKDDPERWTEIDVFEIGGGAPGFEKKMNMTVHVLRTPVDPKHWQIHTEWVAPTPLADDFHVYGLEWDPAELKFFFDGALVWHGPNTHWHQALTLNLDSETMPDWFGMPRDADLPSTYDIDYVRVWKRPLPAAAEAR